MGSLHLQRVCRLQSSTFHANRALFVLCSVARSLCLIDLGRPAGNVQPLRPGLTAVSLHRISGLSIDNYVNGDRSPIKSSINYVSISNANINFNNFSFPIIREKDFVLNSQSRDNFGE